MIKNLFFYFLVIVSALIANNYALYSNLQTLLEQEKWVTHTYKVLQSIESIYSDLRSAEAVGRGYMIVPREESFVVEMNNYVEDIWQHFALIDVLTGDNPNQQQDLQELRGLLEERLYSIQQNMVVARDPKALAKRTELILRGREATNILKHHFENMKGEEERLLKKRVEQATSSRRLVFITFFFSAFVNLALLTAAYWLIRRHLAAQAARLAEQDRKSWMQAQLIKLGKALSAVHTAKQVADETLKFLTKDLSFPAGHFFLTQEKSAVSIASVATSLKSSDNHRFSTDEGLVGAALKRADLHQIQDVPPSYFSIQSGLGNSVPKNLLFIPLRFQNTHLGVIELASFQDLSERTKELLEQVQDRIAVVLNATLAQEKQADLLEETQRQSEELQAQQEELRTNNEELEEQATALLKAQERQQIQQEELQQINEELEAQARSLELQQETLEISRRESEQRAVELEQANQYKTDFLAKMSHELRTPLNSMLILSSLLGENKDQNLSTQQLEFVKTIHGAGADLLNLINDILDLSKLDAGKLSVNVERFELKSYLQNLETQFQPVMNERNNRFIIEIGPHTPETICTDRQRLDQILRNLLSNAAKFTENGEVKLDVQISEGDASRLRLAVHDTGIGIPPDKKRAIFEAFEQVDGSISRRFGGTGLGLTISRELAHLLMGTIEVESQENVGSTFILEIPAQLELVKVQTPPAPARVEPAPIPQVLPVTSPSKDKDIDQLLERVRSSSKGRSLLIVEDDLSFIRALEESARAHGFNPVSVTDGETALELMRKHIPAAILLDIKLPGMSGMNVLESIKQDSRLRHIPIHMISALDYHVPALKLGAIGYLGKPVTVDGIKGAFHKIERMLDKQVKRVLIIEDDERQAKATIELLKGPGVEITPARSAAEAMDLVKSQDFECLIVDLSLPDLSGLELLEKLHLALGTHVPPIIIYTGRDLSREEEEKLRFFSESIIIKGAKSPERLLDEVNLFLHRVEADLPEEQRSMLTELRMREKDFEGRSVLLVDDDLRNIFALTSALESKGLKVVAARNGIEALDVLDKNPQIDAILMDIMMPKMDGYEAIRRIRAKAQYKKLPIIALTAKAMKGDHEKCLKAGANDYLPKPVNLMNLISVLKVWLNEKRMWL